MNEIERELDLQLAEALAENRALRQQNTQLQVALERINAISHLAIHPSGRPGVGEAAPSAIQGQRDAGL